MWRPHLKMKTFSQINSYFCPYSFHYIDYIDAWTWPCQGVGVGAIVVWDERENEGHNESNVSNCGKRIRVVSTRFGSRDNKSGCASVLHSGHLTTEVTGTTTSPRS